MKLLYLSTGAGWPFNWLDTAINHAIIDGKIDGHALDLKLVTDQVEILKFAQEHKPKIILTMNSTILSMDIVRQLRRKGFKVALWATDDPYDSDSSMGRAKYFDIIFTTEIGAVPYYKAIGKKQVYYVPLGADTNHYKKLEVEESYQSDICILGTAFDVRLKAIDHMADYLKTKKTLLVGQLWENLKSYPVLQQNIRSGIFPPTEAAKFYSGAKVVINIHRAFDCKYMDKNHRQIKAYSPNNRIFDIAATKTFQIIGYRRDVDKFLKNHHECEIAMNANEIIDLCEEYLVNPKKREEVAMSSYHKVMQQYKMSDSLKKMLNLLKI